MEMLHLHHSRSTALVTTLGGLLVAGLSIGAVVSENAEGPWTVFIGIVGAIGVVIGLRQLFGTKPAITVNDDGILIEAGMIPWNSIRGTSTSHGGFPIKLRLHLLLDNGQQIDIPLQELNMRPGKALDEIVSRLEIKRPDLVVSQDEQPST